MAPPGPNDEPVRGRGDPVDTRESLSLDDDIEYDHQAATFTVVVTRDADGPVETSEWEVGDWLDVQCPKAAGRAVRSAIDDRLDGPMDNLAVRAGTDAGPDAPASITVRYRTWVDDDGAVTAEPAVDFDEVVAVSPESALATVEFDGHESSCELPVYVERETARLL